MSHDKIRAAARKRMAETGEPYATARREVIKDYQAAGAASSSTRDGSLSATAIWAGFPCGMRHGGVGARDAGACRSTRPCCGFGCPISIWTSPAARCDRPPVLITRPGGRSGYTAAEGAGW